MNTHIRTTPRQPHVLAVDDEPLNLVVIEGALAALDCRIVAAHDAATAMDAMLADRPDLVLLDVMMPGESGLALCRRMRSHPDLIDVPVILVTALDAATSRTV
ncbi:MAG: response regulator, partial [Acidimicrobiia bacterium]|nr:response regulator [Acidimicrobiia bacterium]